MPANGLSRQESEAVRERFKNAEARTRRAMVSTFLLQGQTPAAMAKMIRMPEEEVKKHYEDALDEIKSEMDRIPEGPLHVSEVVIEGYSRLVQRILANCEEANQRLGMSTYVDPKAEMAMVAWTRLSLDAFDKLTDRMQAYGLLPMVPRSGVGHGGVRPGKVQLKENFDAVIREYAAENGINLEEETQEVIKNSVGR